MMFDNPSYRSLLIPTQDSLRQMLPDRDSNRRNTLSMCVHSLWMHSGTLLVEQPRHLII
jgi:hypothetical protein